jgi:RHS repeat-associated protein
VYAYDPVGNRLTKTAAAGTTSYSYNSDDELLSAAGPSATTSYTYDADGNMLTAGAKAYAYDLENRMTSSSSGAITTSYTYDGDGNRRTLSGGANQLRFAWDTNYAVPQLATEYQGATPAVLRDYVYGRQRIAMKQAGNVAHYYQHDGLGSVVGVTGNDGSQEWSYAYDAFGNSLTTTKVAPLAPANPMRFTGQYFDPSGLYAFEARSYDSSLGRFLQTDPIGADLDTPFSGSYGYVGNRATVMVDPDGRSAVIADSPWWVGVGEVLGGATLGAAGAVTGGLGLLVYVAIDSQDPVPPFDASPCPVSDPNFDPVTAINPWQPNPGPAELDRILGQQENVVSKGDPVLHGGPGRPPGGRWGGIAAGGAAASGVVYCLISGKCGE